MIRVVAAVIIENFTVFDDYSGNYSDHLFI